MRSGVSSYFAVHADVRDHVATIRSKCATERRSGEWCRAALDCHERRLPLAPHGPHDARLGCPARAYPRGDRAAVSAWAASSSAGAAEADAARSPAGKVCRGQAASAAMEHPLPERLAVAGAHHCTTATAALMFRPLPHSQPLFSDPGLHALQVGRGRVSAGGQSRWPNAALNFPDDD